MKKASKYLIALLLTLSTGCWAQTAGHSVALTWTAGLDNQGFNVYRSTGTCPASVSDAPLTTGFTKIASLTASTPTSYTDSSVTLGAWCYFVTATAQANGTTLESGPSNTVNPSVLPFPVTGLTVQVK